MSPFDAYDRIVALGASEAHAARVGEMRRAWQARTGAYAPTDAWFEVRSRAFWDDALTTQGFAREVRGELPEEAHAWTSAMSRAHRGLFSATVDEDGAIVLDDVIGGAAFAVHLADAGSRDALSAATGLFDARLVADGGQVAILPGALFHPEDATDAIALVLRSARAKELATDALLDALLRMERSLRSLSRVKAAYAYRESALHDGKSR